MKNKLTKGLCLTALIVFSIGGVAQATGNNNTHSMHKGEPIQSQNARQKTQHTDRKTAAALLKVAYQQQLQKHLKDSANGQQGHTGLGKRGDK
ncbi:MAG: hypothetical protein NTX38_00040 [Methylobacter sp.]|nr:hypothetical protein [Methylobacter sp.]